MKYVELRTNHVELLIQGCGKKQWLHSSSLTIPLMDDKTDPSPTNPLEMKESEEKEFEALTGESVDKEKKEKVRRSALF